MKSIVIVDDDQDLADSFQDVLELAGIQVKGTENNRKEAVELYQKYTPDVVLMDLMMPDFDGFYGLKNIHKLDSNAKVIILTGSTEYDTDEKLTELGVSAIMRKPFDVNNLVETIEKVSLVDAIELNN